MTIKSITAAFSILAGISVVTPAVADYRCNNPYGCVRTRVLWAYGVPGVAVGFYKHHCESQPNYGARYYASIRPGQIPGSNVVTCYVEETYRRGG